jgi:CheY-like chemotaxis protein
MAVPTLAIVDDDSGVCDFFGQVAKECGFDVFATTDSTLFLKRVMEIGFAVIILDLFIPGVDGIELLRALATLSSKAKILLASGVDGKLMDVAYRLGQERNLDMAGVIRKPIRLQALRHLLSGLAPKAALTPAAACAETRRVRHLVEHIERE